MVVLGGGRFLMSEVPLYGYAAAQVGGSGAGVWGVEFEVCGGLQV